MLGAERGLAAAPRLHQPHPPAPPARTAAAGTHPAWHCPRSRDWAPVEYVFPCRSGPWHWQFALSGWPRACTRIGMARLAYNLRQLVQFRGRVTG